MQCTSETQQRRNDAGFQHKTFQLQASVKPRLIFTAKPRSGQSLNPESCEQIFNAYCIV